ncbi:MAG: TlyA family RNA methyltransferase [Pseudomonadota bacterium]
MNASPQSSHIVGPERLRLDLALVERGLAQSRSRARDMLTRGCVTVDGTVISKAGALVSADVAITVDDPASNYVSRAALKLLAGLAESGFDPNGRLCVDLGASTGGFTQVLLERGAHEVIAVDVGHGQLHPSLANDARIALHEGQNARSITPDFFLTTPQAVVSDMSFISLRLAAEPTLRLAAMGAWAILLVKPQFELDPKAIGKGGLVSDPAQADAVAEDLRLWLDALPGWRATGLLPSPVLGGDGNREFLLYGERDV